MEDFLSKYLDDCLNVGVTSIPNICEKAQLEIGLIDESLKALNELKERQTKLRGVVRQLGGAQHKSNDKCSIVNDFSVPEAKLEIKFRNFIVDVCNFIENNSTGVLPRQIMDSLSSIEDNNYVYSAIKWLADKEIIIRMSESRLIMQGPKWQERPI